MKIARVVGTVVAPVHHPAYDGRRLLAVRPINPDGSDADDRMFVAIDRAHAGVGDRVLLLAEGSSVRDVVGDRAAPIRCAVVAVLDEIEVRGERTWPRAGPADKGDGTGAGDAATAAP